MLTNAKSSSMRELSLSEEEASELLHLLEQSLGETRVELHRTHTPDFRSHVQHQETIFRGLIEKLRQPSAC